MKNATRCSTAGPGLYRIYPDLPEQAGSTAHGVELHAHAHPSSPSTPSRFFNGVAERSLRPHGAIRILPVDPGQSGALPLSSNAILPLLRDRRSRSAFRRCTVEAKAIEHRSPANATLHHASMVRWTMGRWQSSRDRDDVAASRLEWSPCSTLRSTHHALPRAFP